MDNEEGQESLTQRKPSDGQCVDTPQVPVQETCTVNGCTALASPISQG